MPAVEHRSHKGLNNRAEIPITRDAGRGSSAPKADAPEAMTISGKTGHRGQGVICQKP